MCIRDRYGVSIKICDWLLFLDCISNFLIFFDLSFLSIGKYPLKLKLFPFSPELIIAKRIEEGPTSGITLILFSWACKISLAPGSAIFGHPASVNSPMFSPIIHGLSCLDVAIGSSSFNNSKFS